MTDYDARRSIYGGKHVQRNVKKTWHTYQCAECGRWYQMDFDPHIESGAMTDKGYVCRDCRSKSVSKKNAPIPESVSAAIEERFGEKRRRER